MKSSMRKACRRVQLTLSRLLKDHRGIAATEFAIIVPIMLLIFFGTVELTSAIAVKRKVTTMARTIADLTSQAAVVNNPDLTNFFAADSGIMTPYSPTPITMRVSELYIDPTSGDARVQWSYASGMPVLAAGTPAPVAVPAGLISKDPVTNAILANQYLIYGEVNYTYVPAVGYVLGKAGVMLSDVAYTRPRQSTCVFYPSMPSQPATCPTL